MNLYSRVTVLLLILSQTGCAYFSGVDLPDLEQIEYIQVRYNDNPIKIEQRIYDRNTIEHALELLSQVNNGWRQPILTPMPGYQGSAAFIDPLGETLFVLWFSGNPKRGWWLGSADRTKEGGITYVRNNRDENSKAISLLLITEQK